MGFTDPKDRAAIDAFLAKNQPRKYVEADSGDDFNLCNWLRSKGYEVQRPHAFAPCADSYFLIEGKPFTRKAFLALVNKVRAAFDMQPLGCPA